MEGRVDLLNFRDRGRGQNHEAEVQDEAEMLKAEVKSRIMHDKSDNNVVS